MNKLVCSAALAGCLLSGIGTALIGAIANVGIVGSTANGGAGPGGGLTIGTAPGFGAGAAISFNGAIVNVGIKGSTANGGPGGGGSTIDTGLGFRTGAIILA